MKCKQSRSLRSRPAGCLTAPSEAARLGGRCWVGPTRRAARPVPARLVCRAVLRAKVVRGPCLARGPVGPPIAAASGAGLASPPGLRRLGVLLLAAPRRLFGPGGRAPAPGPPGALCASFPPAAGPLPGGRGRSPACPVSRPWGLARRSGFPRPRPPVFWPFSLFSAFFASFLPYF